MPICNEWDRLFLSLTERKAHFSLVFTQSQVLLCKFIIPIQKSRRGTENLYPPIGKVFMELHTVEIRGI